MRGARALLGQVLDQATQVRFGALLRQETFAGQVIDIYFKTPLTPGGLFHKTGVGMLQQPRRIAPDLLR